MHCAIQLDRSVKSSGCRCFGGCLGGRRWRRRWRWRSDANRVRGRCSIVARRPCSLRGTWHADVARNEVVFITNYFRARTRCASGCLHNLVFVNFVPTWSARDALEVLNPLVIAADRNVAGSVVARCIVAKAILVLADIVGGACWATNALVRHHTLVSFAPWRRGWRRGWRR